jgi:hypothetical protein
VFFLLLRPLCAHFSFVPGIINRYNITIHDARLSLRLRSLAVRGRFRSILGFYHLSRRFCLLICRRNRRRWLEWIQLHGML